VLSAYSSICINHMMMSSLKALTQGQVNDFMFMAIQHHGHDGEAQLSDDEERYIQKLISTSYLSMMPLNTHLILRFWLGAAICSALSRIRHVQSFVQIQIIKSSLHPITPRPQAKHTVLFR
jgi:hypothetical protein